MATAQDFLQNPTWVHRMEEMFVVLDTNKNGRLSVEDWQLWADNIEKEVKPAAPLMAALRARTEEYCAAMGIVRGKQATKAEFLKGIAAMAVAERAKKEKGEETVLHKLNNAFYDIVDTNHDGCVTLDEWKIILRACNFDVSTADETFKIIDKNKNVKIERKELSDTEFKFWYTLDDADSQGMFGDKFEKK